MTGPVSLSLTQPCSMRLSDLHVTINLLPSFSSNGRTEAFSAEGCSTRGLLRTCGERRAFCKSDTHHRFIYLPMKRCERAFIILTGVSGSSENRFSRSSLLAERILSSVSAIYCEMAKQTERQGQTTSKQKHAGYQWSNAQSTRGVLQNLVGSLCTVFSLKCTSLKITFTKQGLESLEPSNPISTLIVPKSMEA